MNFFIIYRSPLFKMSQPTLLLSSGGQRSAYMQGFLKAVDYKDWEHVFGISAGAMLGALIAQTEKAEFSEEISKLMKMHVEILKPHVSSTILSQKLSSVLNLVSAIFWHTSIYKSKLRQVIEMVWKKKPHKKLVVGSYNVTEGKYRMKKNPDITDVVASASIPVVFPSVTIDGNEYVDGAVAHTIPIEELKTYYNGGDIYVMLCYQTDHDKFKKSMADNRRKLLGRVYSTIDESTWNTMNRDLDDLADFLGLTREQVRISGQHTFNNETYSGTLYMFIPNECRYIDLNCSNYHVISMMQDHGKKVAAEVLGISKN